MNLFGYRKLQLMLVIVVATLCFFSVGVNQSAQTKAQIPAPSSHVSDLSGVLDDQTKQRLEDILENLKQRKKIEFCLAIVETTAGQDIFDFSRQLAHDWNLGSRTTETKSLLMVLAVTEKSSFTQFSRSVQGDLPDGVLGEMSQRMRAPIAAGNFGEALNVGVNHFVQAIAIKSGLTLQDFERPPEVIAAASTPEPTPTPDTSATAAPVAEATPAATSISDPVKPAARNKRTSSSVRPAAKKLNTPEDDANEAEEVELTLTLPFEPRVAKLKEWLETHPRSKVRAHAQELLISAYAALGDQKLGNADTAGGIDALLLAIDQSPTTISEKLFTGVVSQIPLNLYLRGEKAAALKAAQNIETKFGDDAKHLLAIAAFYLRIENGDEAVRVAAKAVKLAPDSAEAHQALALSLHISLRLDEAMAEYKRALDLDPKGKSTRRNLADLNRATGKAQEALVLYREQLSVDPTDKGARTGLILAYLDTGQKDDAVNELDAALKDDPKNLALLTGAAYWFAAHGDPDRAVDLARRAVEVEPRYTWAQIAAGRALVAYKQPLEAERAVRYARQYGKFPTLDYELASVLAATGLYDESAEALQQSFVLKDGQIETKLAGRLLTHEASFLELLAPERRASIFQFVAADTEANAAMLKSLLAFRNAINESGDKGNEDAIVSAAKQFAGGDDDMRSYRQLYAANQLMKKNIALPTVYELAQNAKAGIDAAISVPAVTVAVQADEFREIRARAIASGGTPDIPDAPKNVLKNILVGRVEDLSGWALFNQDKAAEAMDYLKRAAAILPEGTPSWRTALWHLGAALEQTGQKDEALNSYIKSYISGDPEPTRRQQIEQLYRKINGSLDGLDQRIAAVKTGVSSAPADPNASSVATNQPAPTPEPAASSSTTETSAPRPPSAPASETKSTPEKVEPKPDNSKTPPDSKVAPEPAPTPSSPSEEEAMAQAAARIRSSVKVTGRVKDANNKGVSNVVVVLISPRGTVLVATTDAEGKYSFSVSPSQRNYRLVPSKDGMIFDPVDRAVVAFGEDLKEIDFVANSHTP